MTAFPTLFSPMQIGPRVVRNRIWQTGHSTHLVKDHNYTEGHINYYRERARGGVGIITMEGTAIHPTTQPYEGRVFAFDERVIPNYERISAAVHEFDCRILAQLWHRGRQTHGVVNRLPVWAPSPIPDSVYREMPHQMTKAEIREIIENYAKAARYAVIGNLDGVEIHGIAHGYLVGQFISPATNHRTDEYGGSFKNRMRFLYQIIDAVRNNVPDDRIVGIRINGDDGDVEGGLRNEQWCEIARAIADTGALDYISVSQGTYLHRQRIYAASPEVPGYQIPATRNIKKAVPELPIVAVGRITTPELAETILANGYADMIGMARALIADPEWGEKARRGESHRIRPCVGANWCLASVDRGKLACIHNPAVAREETHGTQAINAIAARVHRAKKVAVVGAGPGGLRAAYTAARLGHEVTLYEKAQQPGGQVALFTQERSHAEWRGVIDWLVSECELLKVDIRLGTEATAAMLRSGGYDDVILATGSEPLTHGWNALHPVKWGGGERLPGSDQWNVLTLHDVFQRPRDIPHRVLIYDDPGDRDVLIAAEFLADHGHPVEIVTRLTHVAPSLAHTRDTELVYGRLRNKGITFRTNTEVVRIDGDAVTLRDVYTGECETLDGVDAAILHVGYRANDELWLELADDGELPFNLHQIGDCVAPRRIFYAIWEAENVAMSL